MSTTTIYQKLQIVQSKIRHLVKTKENKFQNYKYVVEYDILRALNPLLNEHKLLLTFSDEIITDKQGENAAFNSDSATNLSFQKVEKEWIIKYLKKATFINAENPSEQLIYHFWAPGQNTDIAKAKGSAETYAIKYFLMKFFLIPTSDNLDPDNNDIEQLYSLYLKKIGDDLTKQKTFFTSFDNIVSKYKVQGQTTVDNLKLRMNLLKKEDFTLIIKFLA